MGIKERMDSGRKYITEREKKNYVDEYDRVIIGSKGTQFRSSGF